MGLELTVLDTYVAGDSSDAEGGATHIGPVATLSLAGIRPLHGGCNE
jgi:hypothetical protein